MNIRKWLTGLLLFMAVTLSALNFDELIPSVSASPLVQQALLDLEAAERAVLKAQAGGFVRIDISPEAYVNESAAGAQMGLTASYPLFLLPEERLELSGAQRDLEIARDTLEKARAEALAELYSRYSATYLAQQLVKIETQRLSAVRQELETVQQLFESGQIPFSRLDESRSAVNDASNRLLSAEMEYRLSWFELAAFTGRSSTVRAELVFPVLSLPDLPPLQTLQTLMYQANTQSAVLEARLEAAQEQLNAVSAVSVAGSLRTGINLPSIGIAPNLSFNSETGDASLSLDLPLYSLRFDSSAEGGNQDSDDISWSVELGLSLSYRGGQEQRVLLEAAEGTVEGLELAVDVLRDSLDLQLRTLYQRYNLGLSSLDLDEEALAAAREAADIMELRFLQGAVREAELSLARAAVDVALLSREKSLIELDKTMFEICLLAGLWQDSWGGMYENE